jgi:signal transduction histidine kinase
MAEFIRDFFAANRVIVLFVYGQVFFILGLAIALQSLRHSRLALARNLNWLAAFGLAHGLHGWGDVFIPLQAEYLAAPFVEALLGLQLILLPVSFACLFQFGVETLRPLPNHRQFLRYGPAVVLALWIFAAFGPTLTYTERAIDWYRINNILGRYLLGFPGSLLAAYGLRQQTFSLIAPLHLPHIVRTLRVAGLALIGYGITAGLAVPASNFSPANWFNANVVEQVTLIPVEVYGSLFGLILTLAMIRALEVFRVELDRHISSLEEQQMLITERERIGRELHDGTLQTIYAAGLLLKSSEKELAQQDQAAKSLARVQQSIALLDEAVADIRSYIGVLRARASGHNLVTGLQELATANHLRSLFEVELSLDLPEDRPLSVSRVGHLLAITNEALSNVVRHAQATRVQVAAITRDERLHLEIKDNGRGLPNDYIVGYGLNNMRDRARMLGGDIQLYTKPGQGTTVVVEVPWSEEEYEEFKTAAR